MSYMKSEFDKIIRNYGHDVYLQRRINHYNGKSEYSGTYEIWSVRHMESGSLPDAQQETKEGINNSSERIYWFTAEAAPNPGDRIHEVDANLPRTIWTIDVSLPLRGVSGEIEFFKTGCSREWPN